MTIRKVPLRELAGVELFRIDRLGLEDEVLSTLYELVTPASPRPQTIEGECDAHKRFDMEVRSASTVSHPAFLA